MLDESVFRDEVRKLKALIRDDAVARARYDLDGDGRIGGEEWDHALKRLREELERRPEPQAAASTFESLRAGTAAAVSPAQPSLVTCRDVVIRQLFEHREALLGYETCNRYTFLDGDTGVELGSADESSGGVGGFLSRQLLGPARPLNLNILDSGSGVWVEGHRPFSPVGFILPPTLAVHCRQQLLGTVQRIWPLILRRRYRISVANDFSPGLMIDGSLWQPWTFPVRKGSRQVASILKKWSGGLRELFTDADTFVVRFEDPQLSDAERRLLVAAALAIDFDFFEKGQ